MAEIINLFRNKSEIILSKGTAVNIDSETLQEAFKAFDGLLNSIVMEHFEEIAKISVDEGNYDTAAEILEGEVNHVVENQIENHRGALEWILTTLVMQRFEFIISEINKNQQNEEK